MATVEELLVRIDSTSEQLRREMKRADQSVQTGGRNINRSVARVERSMDRLNRSATLVTRSLGAFGAALSVRQIGRWTEQALSAVEAISDLNERTGVATTTIQAFRHRADQTGASMGAADDALSRFSRRMGLFAVNEGGAGADAFRRLGIAVRNADGSMRSTEEVFRQAIDDIAALSSESEQAAVASQLFGETAGPALAASLREGQAGLDETAAALRATGRLFDEKLIRKGARASAQIRDLRAGLTTTFQAGLLEGFLGDFDTLHDMMTDTRMAENMQNVGEVLGNVIRLMAENIDIVERVGAALLGASAGSWAGRMIGGQRGRAIGGIGGAAAGLFSPELRELFGGSDSDFSAEIAEIDRRIEEVERSRQDYDDIVGQLTRRQERILGGEDVRTEVSVEDRTAMIGEYERRISLADQALVELQMRRQEMASPEPEEVVVTAFERVNTTLTGTSAAAGGAASAANELQEAMEFLADRVASVESLQAVNAAMMESDEAARELMDTQERMAEIANLNIDANSDLARAINQTLRAEQRATRQKEQIEAAQDRIRQAVEATQTPLERYRATVDQINADRPFARTAEDVEALNRALSDARAEIDPLYSEMRDLAGNIENDFASAFEAAFSRGADLGETLADNLRRTFGRLAAQLVRQQIVVPIVAQITGQGVGGAAAQGSGGLGQLSQQLMGGTGLGGIGSTINQFGGMLGFAQPNALAGTGHWLGGTTPGIFGTTTTLTGALGAAGMGAGIGSMVGGLTGGNQMGSTIGGGLGGAIGSIFGPIGTVAGSAIGGGIGGLFGPGKSSNASGRTFDLASGRLLRSAGGGGANAQVAEQIASAASAFNQQLAEALDTRPVQRELGITAADDGISFWNSRVAGGDVEGAIGEAQRQIIEWLPGLSGKMRDALGRAFDRGSLDESLAFLGQYNEGFFELTEQMTQGEAQMQALREQYREVTAQARALGLSTKDITANFKALTAQMRDDFNENVRLAILDITDPQQAALERLRDQYEMQRREARALGGDLGQLNRLYKLQQEQIKATSGGMQEQIQALNNALSAATGIQQWLDGQIVGQGSSLSPTERLAEAQRQFGSALSDVRGGDLSATGALTGAADTLLSLGREQFASSVDFAALERSVRSQLQGVQATITSDRFIGDQVEKAIRQSGQDQVNELQALRREVALLRRDVQKAA